MGHHFTTDIVVRATGFLGLGGIHDQVSRGRELIDGNYDLNKQNDYYWKSRGWVEDKATDEQRATVFRDAMKELFPQMPDEDVVMVLTRAILKVSRCNIHRLFEAFHRSLTLLPSLAVISFSTTGNWY